MRVAGFRCYEPDGDATAHGDMGQSHEPLPLLPHASSGSNLGLADSENFCIIENSETVKVTGGVLGEEVS